MSLTWYPRYPGDYARDTGTLSLSQHGAYNVLLDHYYSTGPIPCNEQCTSNAYAMPEHSHLYRLCRAASKADMEAVDFIIGKYFYLDENGFYRHSNCDKIIAEQEDKHAKRVAAANSRWGNKTDMQCMSNAYENQNQNQRKENPPTPQGGIEENNSLTTKGKRYEPRQRRPTARERQRLALDEAIARNGKAKPPP